MKVTDDKTVADMKKRERLIQIKCAESPHE